MSIKKKSVEGEQTLNSGSKELAPVPRSGGTPNFTKEEVLEAFKDFYIRKPIVSLVGGTVTQGEGEDIDLVANYMDLPDDLKTAIDFRLMKQVQSMKDIEWNDVLNYVQILQKEQGQSPFTDNIPLYALKLERISEAEVIEMGEAGIEFSGDIRLKQEGDDGDRIIAGYASFETIDWDDQLITTEALREALNDYMECGENSTACRNIMISHSSTQIGTALDEFNEMETSVDEKGLYIVAKIRDDIDTAKEVWEGIEKGELESFSVKIEVLASREVNQDGRNFEQIDDVNLLEVSVCEQPVNPKAKFEVISKEIRFDQENLNEDSLDLTEVRNQMEQLDNDDNCDEEFATVDQVEELQESVEELKELFDTDKYFPAEKQDEGGELADALIGKVDEMIDNAEGDIKEDLKELRDMIDNLSGQGKYPFPAKYPYPSQYPYPSRYPYPKEEELKETIASLIKDEYLEKSEEEEKETEMSEKSSEEKSEEGETETEEKELKKTIEKQKEHMEKLEKEAEKVEELEEKLAELQDEEVEQTMASPEKGSDEYKPSIIVEGDSVRPN